MLEVIEFCGFEFKLIPSKNDIKVTYVDSQALLTLIINNISPRIVLKSWIGNHVIIRFFENVHEDKIEQLLNDNVKIITESINAYLIFRENEVKNERARIKDKIAKYEMLL